MIVRITYEYVVIPITTPLPPPPSAPYFERLEAPTRDMHPLAFGFIPMLLIIIKSTDGLWNQPEAVLISGPNYFKKRFSAISYQSPLGGKNSCVSTNMLKKIWSVGRRNFFYFTIFSPEKNRIGTVIV